MQVRHILCCVQDPPRTFYRTMVWPGGPCIIIKMHNSSGQIKQGLLTHALSHMLERERARERERERKRERERERERENIGMEFYLKNPTTIGSRPSGLIGLCDFIEAGNRAPVAKATSRERGRKRDLARHGRRAHGGASHARGGATTYTLWLYGMSSKWHTLCSAACIETPSRRMGASPQR